LGDCLLSRSDLTSTLDRAIAPPPAPDGAPSILLVHERYQQRAGEDAVFDAELALLRRMGRDVRTLVVDNAEIPSHPGIRAKVRLGAETMWSSRAAARVRRRLEREPADVVHIHNTFPLLSPSIHIAARDAGAAVVQTIHNYRPICPAATLFRDGAPCHDCVGRTVAWPSVVHACFRGSRVQTLPVAGMLAAQRLRRSWSAVHAIIALTDFAAARLVEGGLPADRIHVKGNFVEPSDVPRVAPGEGFLYVGRLSHEKGIGTLAQAVAAMPAGTVVRIAGDGPEGGLLDPLDGRDGVVRLGRIDPATVRHELARARALVFPSLWYEGMPMTILEAFAAGLPVIAARSGAAAELVRDGETGLTFEPGDADGLARAMMWANDHPTEMAALGDGARRAYLTGHTPEAHHEMLVAIHAAALRRAHANGAPALAASQEGRPA
jgi:glycosyltransferase involved in cell wall biosynthesis